MKEKKFKIFYWGAFSGMCLLTAIILFFDIFFFVFDAWYNVVPIIFRIFWSIFLFILGTYIYFRCEKYG